MKEVSIEKLPQNFIDYVRQVINSPISYVKGIPLFYSKGGCHVNSILLCDDIMKNNQQYHCFVVEGIVVCKNGLAYDHCWNLIRDDQNGLHYVDITMDAIASDYERETEKTYYVINEFERDVWKEKIVNKQPMFSDDVHRAINEYYAKRPEKEAEYRAGKIAVESL